MTAGANWTGINPSRAPRSALPAGSADRAHRFSQRRGRLRVATAAELGFFVFAAVAMMRAVYRARNVRNYACRGYRRSGAADGLYLLAARSGDYALLMQRLDAGLLVMALIALLVARRVIPFFAMRAVAGFELPLLTRTGQVQLGVCVVAVICLLAGLRLPTAIALGRPASCRAAGGAMESRTAAASADVDPLRGYAAAASPSAAAGAAPVYCRALRCTDRDGGLLRVIIGWSRARTRPTRPARATIGMLASTCMLAPVALRLAAITPSTFSQAALHLSAAAWIAALALYLWRFAPLLIRPRA